MGREKKVEIKMKKHKKKENLQKKRKRENVKKNKNHSNKKYRGRGKANAMRGFFSVLLVNLRGFRSKKFALEKELKKIKPSIVLINETQLSGKAKVSLRSYTSWSRNRGEQRCGGVATCVSQQFKDSALGVGEGSGNDEFLVTRFDCFNPALSVINCYGEQRKTTKDEVEAKWFRLRKEMEASRSRNDFCLLAGDLNKLVGCDALGVPGNHPELSVGGKLLRELLATRNWFLVNALGEGVVEGGPFTREDPASMKLSCLDLFIVSRELKPYVSKLLIDSDRKFKIGRTLKSKGKHKFIYPDHFPWLLPFVYLPKEREQKEEKLVRWNLAKEGGWDRYNKLTEKYVETILKVVENKEMSIEEINDKFEKLHDKIKFKAFGKVTINPNKKKESIANDKVEPDEVKAKKILEEQIQKAAEEIELIKKSKGGKVEQIWEAKKRIFVGKKATIEATVIIDPNSRNLVVSKEQIKKIRRKFNI